MKHIWKLLANIGIAIVTMVAMVILYVCNINIEHHGNFRRLYGYRD